MKVSLQFFLVFLILIMSLLPAMWNEAVNFSYNSSFMMENYPEAAKWLVLNMGANETALVPVIEIFEALEPDLKGRLVRYSDIWEGANVVLEADNDLEDILTVRRYLVKYLKQEKTSYIVVSQNDPYSGRLFEREVQDELVLFKVIEFHSEGSIWNERITVYKFASVRREIFSLALTTEPQKYETRGDIDVSFGETGMAILYEGDSGVYIPLFLNSSVIEKLLLTVHVTQMSSQVEGNIVLYLDKNGNGKWDNWDVDGGILIPLPEKTPSFWGILMSQEFYKIGYDIVMVSLVLNSESPQTIAVKFITFYEVY